MDPLIQKAIDDAVAKVKKELSDFQEIFFAHQHLKYDQSAFLPTNRVALADGATIAVNAMLANHFYCTLGGNRTLDNPSNARDGQRLIFELIQDGTGNRTITMGSKFVAGPWTITLTTTADKRDFIECIYSSLTDKFYIVNFQKGYS